MFKVLSQPAGGCVQPCIKSHKKIRRILRLKVIYTKIPRIGTGYPHHFGGLIFFFRISMVFCVVGDFSTSFSIFSIPCFTVVWSLFPMYWPMAFSELSVRSRHRYIAI